MDEITALANIEQEIANTPLAIRKAYIERVPPTHELYRQVKIYGVLIQERDRLRAKLYK